MNRTSHLYVRSEPITWIIITILCGKHILVRNKWKYKCFVLGTFDIMSYHKVCIIYARAFENV